MRVVGLTEEAAGPVEATVDLSPKKRSQAKVVCGM